MSVWATGDLHSNERGDMLKLASRRWPAGRLLTRDDFLVVAGDAGLNMGVIPRTEAYWLNWLDTIKPWTTLIVLGNHDNYPATVALPLVERFGGLVHQLAENVFVLQRGCVYQVADQTLFVFGGALSVDKLARVHGYNWWPEEEPTHREVYAAFERLAACGNQVDFVVSHAAPRSQLVRAAVEENAAAKLRDSTCDALQAFWDELTFRHWFCGHYHIDQDLDRISFLYQRVVQVI